MTVSLKSLTTLLAAMTVLAGCHSSSSNDNPPPASPTPQRPAVRFTHAAPLF